MIAREFQDTIPGVQDKITKLAQILGKEYRVFNSSDNFAEIGLEFENPRKESNMLLIQALLLEDAGHDREGGHCEHGGEEEREGQRVG